MTFTNAGLLTLNGNITSDGAVVQNGAGVTSISSPRTITTTGDAVSFATGVTLSGAGVTSIDTTSGSAAGASVTFSGALTGTTTDVEHLTVNAGTGGNVVFTGVVGATRLGDIVITNANNVTESAGVTAKSLTQSAGGGTTLLTGAVNTDGATGVGL